MARPPFIFVKRDKLSEGCYNLFVYYVYILQLRDKTHYVGYSSNLKQRINEHIIGNVNQTKNLLPLKLIYYSAFVSGYQTYDRTYNG
ncbi:MAG: excinuclease ABC subunit C [Deltaproteobacteria bacterium CG07_land_8_20_14_0_80_38_7]|nr:MAG: excinuclease ABC subunit C [Deltaproteobacteria bacterium CG07_land_8_20_14_0_80_38_7]